MRFRRQGPSLIVDASAKLNLFLEVCGKRPDGYHELETLMVSISLFDTLRFTPRPDGEISLQTRFVHSSDAHGFPCGDENLIVKAARLLASSTGHGTGVAIELIKRIPAASGLGGGSSDAAATLVGLNRLWQTGLSDDDLDGLAAQLGSDLNFFIRSPRMALCRGRGEIVEPRPLPRALHFVVMRPQSGLSTAEVFRQWKSVDAKPRSVGRLLAGLECGEAASVSDEMFNALTAPAASLSADIASSLNALRRFGGPVALMSGSGSACFVPCRNARHAQAVSGRLRSLGAARVWNVQTDV